MVFYFTATGNSLYVARQKFKCAYTFQGTGIRLD